VNEVRERPQMSEKIAHIEVGRIIPNPAQPRAHFDPQALRELASSIAQHGILQPLTVRQVGDRYELVAGERRLRAAQLLSMTTVPCVLLRVSSRESALLALIENLQRRDLDFFEVALGYQRLMDSFGLTQSEAAARVGKSQSSVANKLRLLRFDSDTMETIRAHKLSERHARALLRLPVGQVKEALAHIIEKELTVAETEAYIGHLLTPVPEVRHETPPKILLKDSRIFLNTVNRALSVMRESGLPTDCRKTTDGDWVVLTIRVPRIRTAEKPADELQ